MDSYVSSDESDLRESWKVEIQHPGSQLNTLRMPSEPSDTDHVKSQDDLARIYNDSLPTEVTLHVGEELLDTGLYFRQRHTNKKSLTLLRIDIRRWILAASLLRERGRRFPGYTIKPRRQKNWELPFNPTNTSKILA